jgi:hypothetical protein
MLQRPECYILYHSDAFFGLAKQDMAQHNDIASWHCCQRPRLAAAQYLHKIIAVNRVTRTSTINILAGCLTNDGDKQC